VNHPLVIISAALGGLVLLLVVLLALTGRRSRRRADERVGAVVQTLEKRMDELAGELAGAVEGIAGVRSERRFFTMVETLEPEPVNCLVVHVDAQEAGVSAADVERTLEESNPRVAVHRRDDTVIVAVDTMLPEQSAYVCERLQAALRT